MSNQSVFLIKVQTEEIKGEAQEFHVSHKHSRHVGRETEMIGVKSKIETSKMFAISMTYRKT